MMLASTRRSGDAVLTTVKETVAAVARASSDPHDAVVISVTESISELEALLASSAHTLTELEKEAVATCLFTESPSLLGYVELGVAPERLSTRCVPAKGLLAALSCAASFLAAHVDATSPDQRTRTRKVAFECFLLLHRLGVHTSVQAAALQLLGTLLKHCIPVPDSDRPPMALSGEPDPASMLEAMLRYVPRCTAQGVRSQMFQIMGVLCRAFSADVVRIAKQVGDAFVAAFETVVDTRSIQNVAAEGLLLGLTDYLVNFELGDEHTREVVAGQLYRFVKAALRLAEGTGRYQLPRATLGLVAMHAPLLRAFFAADAGEMMDIMVMLCSHKNVDLHKRAYPAAAAFVKTVAAEVCAEFEPLETRRWTFTEMISRVKQMIASKEPYTISLAIVTYGLLSRAITTYMSVGQLESLFATLARRFDTLMGAGQQQLEEAVRHLPQLIEAFACIILELTEIAPSMCDWVCELLHSMLLVYPKSFNFPKLRQASVSATLKLLVAARRHPQLWARVLPHFVGAAVSCSVASSGMFSQQSSRVATICQPVPPTPHSSTAPPNWSTSVIIEIDRDDFADDGDDDGGEGGEGGSGAGNGPSPTNSAAGGEGALFEEYLPLWSGLLLVTRHRGDGQQQKQQKRQRHRSVVARWGFPWDATPGLTDEMDVEGTLSELRITTIAHLRDVIVAMDLSWHDVPEKRPGATAHHATAIPATQAHYSSQSVRGNVLIAPRSPKDYSLFLNLTSLALQLLPSLLESDEIIEQWGPCLMLALIDKIYANPHASGVYQLLGATLKLAGSSALLMGSDSSCAQHHQCRSALRHFFIATNAILDELSNELLASAAVCLIAFPPNLTPGFRALLRPLRRCIDMGADHPAAALAALNALEFWLVQYPCAEVYDVVLPAIVPRLGRFLEGARGLDFAGGADSSGGAITEKLLRLLGQEGLRIGEAFQCSSAGMGAERLLERSIDPHDVLKIRVALRDASIDLSLNPLLPRLLVLVEGSLDRKARIAACETLHAVVLWLVGSSAVRSDRQKSPFSVALGHVFPAVLQLAASADALVKTLFETLLMQLSRWYATRVVVQEEEVGLFLDALADGLGKGSSAAVRSTATGALEQLQTTSLRSDMGTITATSKQIHRRLFVLMEGNSQWAQCGAAYAALRLFVGIRDVDALVQEHALELLEYALRVLDRASSVTELDAPEQVEEVAQDSDATVLRELYEALIELVERTVVFRASQLLEPRHSTQPTLAQFVEKHFEKCGAIDRTCRRNAMRLFSLFVTCLPGFDGADGPMRWITHHKHYGRGAFLQGPFQVSQIAISQPDKLLRTLETGTTMTLAQFMLWAADIEAATDCHTWLISARYLQPRVAFGCRGVDEQAVKRKRMELLASPGGAGKRAASSPPPALGAPQSRLLIHLYLFERFIDEARTLNPGAVDSQLNPLPSATVAPEIAPLETSLSARALQAVAKRKLATLTALSTLLHVMVTQFPSCVWLEGDEEVVAAAAAREGTDAAPSVYPLLSMPLYRVAAKLMLTPYSVFGSPAIAGAFRTEVRHAAETLCTTLLTAIKQPSLAHQRAGLIAAIAAVMPFDLEGAVPDVATFIAKAPDPKYTVEGMRWLHSAALLLPSLQHRTGHVRTAEAVATALLRAADGAAADPCVARMPERLGAIECLVDLAGDIGVPPVALLEGIRGAVGDPRCGGGSASSLSAVEQRSHSFAFLSLQQHANSVRGLGVSSDADETKAPNKSAWAALFPDRLNRMMAIAGAPLLRDLATAAAEGALPGGAFISLAQRLLLAVVSARPPAEGGALTCVIDELLAFHEDLLPLTDRLSMYTTLVAAAEDADKCVEALMPRLAPDIGEALGGIDARSHPPHTLLLSVARVQLLSAAAKLVETVSSRCGFGGVRAVVARSGVERLVRRIVTEELPLDPVSELGAESVAFENHLLIIGATLTIVGAVGGHCECGMLFDILPLLRYQSHPLGSSIASTIQIVLGNLPSASHEATLTRCITTLGEQLPCDVIEAITALVALPLLRQVPRETAESIFFNEVGNLVATIASAPAACEGGGVREAALAACARTTCTLHLVEQLYRVCSTASVRGPINRAYAGASATGRELTSTLSKLCWNATVQRFDAAASDPQRVLRFHQAAYSCLVSVILATQAKERIISDLLLKWDRARSGDQWRHIVDLNVQHQFTIKTNFRQLAGAITEAVGEWERGEEGAVAKGSTSEARKQRGINRLKYLSSVYLRDSHLQPSLATGGSDSGLRGHSLTTATSPSQQQHHHATGARGAGASAASAASSTSADTSTAPSTGKIAPGAAWLDAASQSAAAVVEHKRQILSQMQGEADGRARRQGWDIADVAQDAEDFAALTASVAAPRPDAPRQEVVEVDTVWASACFPTLLRLVDHLAAQFSPPSLAERCEWIDELVMALRSPQTPLNVKLVLSRLVMLRPLYFERRAADLFEPMVQCVTDPSVGSGIHYMVRDMAALFLTWREPLPPADSHGEAAGARLMTYLIRSITSEERYILRSNLELVKRLVERWKDRVLVSRRDIAAWLAYDEKRPQAKIAKICGVQLCGVLVANGLPLHRDGLRDCSDVGHEVFYRRVCDNLKAHADVSEAAGEVIGMELAALAECEGKEAAPHATPRAPDSRLLLQLAHGALDLMTQSTQHRTFLRALRRIAEHFPEAIDHFMPTRLFASWDSLATEDRVIVLELTAMRAEYAAAHTYPTMSGAIGRVHSMTDAQRIALFDTLRQMVPHLSAASDLSHLCNTWLRQSHDALSAFSAEARAAFYALCITLFDAKGEKLGPGEAAALNTIISSGLEDASLLVQDMVLKFWDHEQRMPVECGRRFNALFTKVYNPQLRDAWLKHGAILMLFLAHRNADFTRTDIFFPQPLATCAYSEIPVSSRMFRGSLPMTPMFSTSEHEPVSHRERLPASLGAPTAVAASADSLLRRQWREHATPSATSLHGMLALHPESSPSTASNPVPGDRRTVHSRLIFTPTQQQQQKHREAAHGAPPAFTDPGSSLSATASSSAGSRGLRTRFRDMETRTHIMHASQARQMVQVRSRTARQAASEAVTVFRAYRDGEVPDIQLALQSIIVPLQGLCLHDVGVAHTVLTLVGEAVLRHIHKECDGHSSGPSSSSSASASASRALGTFGMFSEAGPNAAAISAAQTLRSQLSMGVLRVMRESQEAPLVVQFAQDMLLALPKGLLGLTGAELLEAAVRGSRYAGAALVLEAAVEEAPTLSPDRRDVLLAHLMLALRGSDDVNGALAVGLTLLQGQPRALGHFNSYVHAINVGDVREAAVQAGRCAAVIRTRTDTGIKVEVSPWTKVASALAHEERVALAQLSEWGGVVRSVDDELDSRSSSSRLASLWDTGSRHALELYVAALARSEDDGTLSELLQLHDEDASAMFPLECAMRLFRAEDYAACARLCRGAMLRTLESCAVSDSSSHRALRVLHLLHELQGASELLSSKLLSSSKLHQALDAAIDGWQRRLGTELTRESETWFDLIMVRTAICNAAVRKLDLRDAEPRGAADAAPAVTALRARMSSLHTALHIAAGASLSASSASYAAAAYFLHSHHFPPGFHATVFREAFAFKLQLLKHRCNDRGTALRQKFNDLRSLLAEKKLQLSPEETEGLRLRNLQGRCAAVFALQIVRNEGATEDNGAELIRLTAEAAQLLSPCSGERKNVSGDTQSTRASRDAHRELCTMLIRVIASVKPPMVASDASAAALASGISRDAVRHLVEYMRIFGDVEGNEQFVAVLQIVANHEAAADELSRLAAQVPMPSLLPWASQLLSTLLVRNGHCVVPLLYRIMRWAPHLLFFPFQCAEEDLVAFSSLPNTHVDVATAIGALRSHFAGKDMSHYQAFAAGLNTLHHPELRLDRWLADIRAVVSQHQATGSATALERATLLWRQCSADCLDPSVAGIGDYNRKFARDYGPLLKEIMCDPVTGTLRMQYDQSKCAAVLRRAREGMTLVEGAARLTLMSETLPDLFAPHLPAIFVPVQPFHLLHGGSYAETRIASVGPLVNVMPSIQKPKRIKFFSTDGRVHSFLVKGGDDLRLDQRIQELFCVINSQLRVIAPQQRALRIRIYSVIPVAKKIGLIEWVEGSEPMKEAIHRGMRRDPHLADDSRSVQGHPASVRYFRMVQERVVDAKTTAQKFLLSFAHPDFTNVKGQYAALVRSWIAMTNRGYLRGSLAAYGVTSSAFFALQRNFIDSYAAQALACYVVGIGDRHLDNFLLDTSTGEVVPIDFGHAFGSATTLLPVPELVPFRLTPQIQGVLGPAGLPRMALPMMQVMRSLEHQRSLIEGLTDVFLREPLLAWEAESTLPVEELAARKISTVRRKLLHEHPTSILSDELSHNRFVERAGIRSCIIAALPSAHGTVAALTIDEQVRVLIEIATDENVLGHTWAGWTALF